MQFQVDLRIIPLFLFSTLLQMGSVIGFRLRSVSIPRFGLKGFDLTIRTEFDLGNGPLLSVKWYKNGHEFFRYLPFSRIDTFPRPGVDVDIEKSNLNEVHLKNLSFDSSGWYRAEISLDRPTFRTLWKESFIKIISLPQGQPELNGTSHLELLKLGQNISINSTSIRSKPAADLSFFINDTKIQPPALIRYPNLIDPDGLESSILGLKFTLEESHFELRCRASLANGYWIGERKIRVKINAKYQESIDAHSSSGTTFFRPNFYMILIILINPIQF